ncbi:hypothetical protein L1887_62135 [Cichorium endivia]|nr:hypothetical protein L1887_62135 [Cichorium endivia]
MHMLPTRIFAYVWARRRCGQINPSIIVWSGRTIRSLRSPLRHAAPRTSLRPPLPPPPSLDPSCSSSLRHSLISIYDSLIKFWPDPVSFSLSSALAYIHISDSRHCDWSILELYSETQCEHLLGGHKHLEALAQSGDVAVALGQGRHDLRMSDDEGRVDALRLDKLARHLVDEARRGAWLGAVDVVLGSQIGKPLARLFGVQLIRRREGDVHGLLELLDHVKALPGRRKVDLVLATALDILAIRVVLDLVRASHRLDQARDHGLGDVHEVVHVGVGHVELADGELGVVRLVDRLVAEDASDLVDAVEAADDELLEEELGGDAHKEVELEVVVEGDKGLGGGAAGDLVHHGRLDLEEAEVVEEAADVVDDLGALDKDVAHVVVHDEVEVALAVALLGVGEAALVALGRLGQHLEAGREQLDGAREDGQLALLGLAGHAGDADDVAAAEQVVDGGKVAVGVVLELGGDLHLDALAVEVVEAQLLAGGAHVVETAGDADLLVVEVLARLDLALVLGDELGERDGDVELVRVGVRVLGLAEGGDGPEATLVVLVGVEVLLGSSGGLGAGSGGRSLGGLGGLLGVLLALLHAALELGLGDHLAGSVILDEVDRVGLVGGVGGRHVAHDNAEWRAIGEPVRKAGWGGEGQRQRSGDTSERSGEGRDHAKLDDRMQVGVVTGGGGRGTSDQLFWPRKKSRFQLGIRRTEPTQQGSSLKKGRLLASQFFQSADTGDLAICSVHLTRLDSRSRAFSQE